MQGSHALCAWRVAERFDACFFASERHASGQRRSANAFPGDTLESDDFLLGRGQQ
jgi:hypothetical protein